MALPAHCAWHSMRRALPRIPVGGSDQICRLQAGTIPTDGPVPVVPERGIVVVAACAVGVPAMRSWGTVGSVEGGLVTAARSRVVPVLGSRAVVGSHVGMLGPGGSAEVATGLAVLGLSVEVTTAAGCSITAANTQRPGSQVTSLQPLCFSTP